MIVSFNSDCNITPTKVRKQHWTQPRFSYMKKPRPDYGIMLLINGKIDFVTPAETLFAKSGDVVFLPKNSYYEANFHIEHGEIDNYLINFESDEKFSDCITPQKIAENVSFSCIDLFRCFIEENYNFISANFRCKGSLYLLFDSIIRENSKKESKNDEVLAKAKELLRQMNNYSIKRIARECLVSESGLRKIFKENIGISPTQFRMNEKINKAKYLLESTDMSVDEISGELNFFDTAYFCKIFCKYVGISPRKYSKNKKL